MSAFEQRCRMAVIVGSVVGIVLAIIMCVAFGVLDIQCSDSPQGQYWNAAEQHCQASEVRP